MMRNPNTILNNEKGATIVYAAIILAVLLMFTAMAVDVGHLYAVRNELQDAADAGALAGASVLFNADSTLNRDAALAEGARIAIANKTGTQYVSEKTVETGHWSFSLKQFTASENTEQTTWHERPFSELDLDNDFINAVRVKADRSDTPSFFAKILGYDQFFVSTDAVAYLGFAGTLYPGEIDKPIAICEDAILDGDSYECNTGRMLNSGGNPDTAMTAMWTNFTQPCDTADANDMKPLTENCDASNPNTITFGQGIGSVNGVQDVIFGNVTDCWLTEADSNDVDSIPDQLWPLLLPVVKCGVDNTCAPLVGAVLVNVVWIVHRNDPHMEDVPLKMDDWVCSSVPTTETERFGCWKEFVNHFQLQNVSGPPSSDAAYQELYQKKNIFFLPSCEKHEPAGNTGGENFGILAKIPKLVE